MCSYECLLFILISYENQLVCIYIYLYMCTCKSLYILRNSESSCACPVIYYIIGRVLCFSKNNTCACILCVFFCQMYSETSDSGPSEIGTLYYKPLYSGQFKGPQKFVSP